MKKKKTIAATRKLAWTLFSIFIRQRDKGICFSCGDRKDWRLQDAGHFYHGKKYPALYFDERNVHCQCTRCNRFLHGNRDEYARQLVKKYGSKVLEELQALKKITKVNNAFYGQIIGRHSK